ncbi:hypothetical protein GOV05_02615 [Candidatus Woesearchaeota archaeon]|nr:hypothetical protein [Candidatus Woesearchaeota archaeon]
MREASWKDCLESSSARKVTPNLQRAKSLIETSKERIDVIGEVNQKNCNFVFEDYYTSILELLQALVIKKGYNVLNHVCLGFYIKDVLKDEELFRNFDDLRYKRNSLTYYGNKMEYEVALESIKKSKKLIESLTKKT